MDEPILSIIVPSYNTSKYVDECLPTFISEKLFGKIVIYLIDDGATDDTAEMIKPYVEKNPQFFKFIHKENGGHGSVINYGVHKLVKTKYFKVIDGDDWVNADALASLVDYLYNCDDDIVVSDYAQHYPNKIIRVNALLDSNTNLSERTSYSISFVNAFVICIHSLTYKTILLKENNIILPEKVFYEDNLYCLYPIIYAKSISYINDCVYCYRLGNPNQSVSISSKAKHINDAFAVRKEALLFYSSNIDHLPLYLSKFIASIIASGLSLYENIVLTSPVNKDTQKTLKYLYDEDKKFPLIIDELKKYKHFRFLYLNKFSMASIFIAKIILSKSC